MPTKDSESGPVRSVSKNKLVEQQLLRWQHNPEHRKINFKIYLKMAAPPRRLKINIDACMQVSILRMQVSIFCPPSRSG